MRRNTAGVAAAPVGGGAHFVLSCVANPPSGAPDPADAGLRWCVLQGDGAMQCAGGGDGGGDSGEWVEARAVLAARTDISHLRLTDLDVATTDDDDTFAWLEVSKVPFAYSFTARVVNNDVRGRLRRPDPSDPPAPEEFSAEYIAQL
eukprot:gene39944-16225_t